MPDSTADPRQFWGFDTSGFAPGGTAYVELVSALRALQDLVTCSDPSPAVAQAARALIGQAAGTLGGSRVEPGRQHSGLRGDAENRGHPLLLPVQLTSLSSEHVEGSVAFSPFYLGGGSAAHGGAIAMLFDECLGRLANSGPPTRTAYLHVNYLKITPIGTPLRVRGRVTKTERRKIFLEGDLCLGEDVLATAEGLWVVLREDAA
ncbi:PaaI family thioesterase [Dactylosporangium sucinum]|uniref:Acyl-coenzyme A thioesterase THEM4 n=1 Tax=Dactylosporangium sucinum TaxID=1424081 RepID=A0A917UG84_9ACTN|nr:PaaI family thioesterase [Dactylosporangium sucinum]GGM87213.1 thioesterase [Dactylosporangium sucinum]